MRWPWRRNQIECDEAQKALENAKRQRAEVEAQWPRVNGVTDDLRQHKATNHFSELIIESMRRKRT